jgi:calcium-dependent protein kinase
LDIKPTGPLDVQEQRTRLRARRTPNQAQLEWSRRVLRDEGALEKEALAFFSRVLQTRNPTALARAGKTSLRAEDMEALGGMVDLTIGVTGTGLTLKNRARTGGSGGCEGLSLETFTETMWLILWGIQKEFGCSMDKANKAIQRREGNPSKDFQLIDDLGGGTYGAVHLMQERSSGTLRAVKFCEKSKMCALEMEAELHFMMMCDHPHIVKVHCIYQDAAHVCLVMDHLKGSELFKVIGASQRERRLIPDHFISTVTRQVLMAIAHVHGRGILHLDLKSQNIMLLPARSAHTPSPPSKPGRKPEEFASIILDKYPHAMVIDFGVARLFQPGNYTGHRPIGSPGTMAPEVWKGEFTPKADVFSVGCVLFEMMSTTVPFRSPSSRPDAEIYWNGSPSAQWQILKHRQAPKEAVELCGAMLKLDRNQRPGVVECLRWPFVMLPDPSASDGPDEQIMEGIASTSSRSVLHKSVALSIARAWPPNRLPVIKRLFEELDVSGNGRLEKTQIRNALERMGWPTTAATNAADAMDLSRDGTVDWTEFVAACIQLSSDAFDAELKKIFQKADSDKDGLLTQDDIRKLLASEKLRAEPGATSDLFAELVGRTEQGARLDWDAFQRHFRLLGGPGNEAGPRLPTWRASLGLPEDLQAEALSWLEQAKDMFWPTDPGEPSEEIVKHLAEMGFTNREVCVGILKRHRNNLASRGLFEELLRSVAN